MHYLYQDCWTFIPPNSFLHPSFSIPFFFFFASNCSLCPAGVDNEISPVIIIEFIDSISSRFSTNDKKTSCLNTFSWFFSNWSQICGDSIFPMCHKQRYSYISIRVASVRRTESQWAWFETWFKDANFWFKIKVDYRIRVIPTFPNYQPQRTVIFPLDPLQLEEQSPNKLYSKISSTSFTTGFKDFQLLIKSLRRFPNLRYSNISKLPSEKHSYISVRYTQVRRTESQ